MGQFEQQALLWVHLRGFARRDAEEGSVEQVDPVDDAGRHGVGFAALARVRVQIRFAAPAVGWDLGDGVRAGG